MPVFFLGDEHIFPDTDKAAENGLLAVGGDLHPDRLIEAYRQGIFPWYSEDDPLLWWFTSPRMVLFPSEIHVSKRLGRYIRSDLFSVTYDKCFPLVIDNCAAIRKDNGEGTWITDDMREAYCTLHDLGYAHSVECWQAGELAGGLYGVTLGEVFFGESMFSCRNNASKTAFVALVSLLQRRSFQIIDCQMTTEHLQRFGAREISGRTFRRLLRKHIQNIQPEGHWKNERFNRKTDLQWLR